MVEPKYATTDVHGSELTNQEQKWIEDPDNRVYPQTYSKLNWKTRDSRDYWKDSLEVARQILQKVRVAQIADKNSNREAFTAPQGRRKRTELIAPCAEHDLVHRTIEVGDRPKRIIGANEDILDIVEDTYQQSHPERIRTLGELTGVPECCLEFYLDHRLEEGKLDMLYEVSCNTPAAEPIDDDRERLLIPDPEPWGNVLYRYFGWSYINYIPCSWNCEHTHEIGERHGEAMADMGHNEIANSLWHWLREPATWDCLKSLAHIRNQHMIGAAQSACYYSKKEIIWREPHQPGGQIVDGC